jgi:hypothetical protein
LSESTRSAHCSSDHRLVFDRLLNDRLVFAIRIRLGSVAGSTKRGRSPNGGLRSEDDHPMADLHKLLFETPAKVSDREILATARLNARVKTFAGREIAEGVIEQINAAIADEADRLIAEGVLQERPDWLAALVSRRLYVAFGSRAVQHLSRELQRMGAV